MDPTIQTPAEEATAARIDKIIAEILNKNARIKEAITRCVSIIRGIGDPDLYQCVGYDWHSMLDMMEDIKPTPNAEQARTFVAEWENGR